MVFSADSAVNLDRFNATLDASSRIGPGRPGGLSRLTLSDADREMRDLFVRWCRDAGLSVTIDTCGNIFALRAGTDPDAPPVVMGSHLDTQINGGRFDGIAGVLAGLEVVRTLNDLDHTTKRPIEVVNWTNEEGARFSPPMVASGCFIGAYDKEWVHALTDDDGLSNAQIAERTGLPKSTVSRLTYTLGCLGYLTQPQRNDRYRPGPTLLAMGQLARDVMVKQEVVDYAIRLVLATHPEIDGAPAITQQYVRYGASPRGAQAMLLAAKIRATGGEELVDRIERLESIREKGSRSSSFESSRALRAPDRDAHTDYDVVVAGVRRSCSGRPGPVPGDPPRASTVPLTPSSSRRPSGNASEPNRLSSTGVSMRCQPRAAMASSSSRLSRA